MSLSSRSGNLVAGSEYIDVTSDGERRCPFHTERINNLDPAAHLKTRQNTARRVLFVNWWEEAGVKTELSAIDAITDDTYIALARKVIEQSLAAYINNSKPTALTKTSETVEVSIRGIVSAMQTISKLHMVLKRLLYGKTPEEKLEIYRNSYSLLVTLANQHASHFALQLQVLQNSENPNKVIQKNFNPAYFVLDEEGKRVDFASGTRSSNLATINENNTPKNGCPALPFLRDLWETMSEKLAGY